MALKTTLIDYAHGDKTLQAYTAWDDAQAGPRPGVLVAHAWRGRTAFENGKAEALARLGYVGFALDVYGKGVTGSTPEQNRALMQPLLDDRPLLQARLGRALEELRAQELVDERRTAAIGFCFGGLCVLDLARSGADLAGVVSFHGLFTAPGNAAGRRARARVLALHGWDDPMATPEAVLAFAAEMSALGADWQVHAYGNTVHAFTNPQAAERAAGLQYDAKADARSWRAMQNFLEEILITNS